MFKKILIAEDLDISSLGIEAKLKEKFDVEIAHTKYCDEAYLKLKKAIQDNIPFDLLISDLSFKNDHREEKITSGDQLIKTIKKEQPELTTILFSVEDRIFKIRQFFDELDINAYVHKSRNSLNELIEAINTITQGEKYVSPSLSTALSHKTILEIDSYDIELVRQLSLGLSQDEISIHFKEQDISPYSLRSTEHRINKVKIYFKAKNTVHLVSMTKDLGLI